MNGLFIVAYIAVVFLLPGYVLLKRFARLGELQTVSLAPAVSLLVYAGVFYILHVLFGTSVDLGIITFILVLSTAGWVLWGIKPKWEEIPRNLVLLFILAFVVMAAMAQFEPVPRVGDGAWHFLLAESFTGKDWFSYGVVDNFWSGQGFPYHPAYRPPLYNFALSLVLVASGTYSAAQLFNIFFASFVALPAYLLCSRLMDGRLALFATALVLSNPFLIDVSLFVFPRVLLVYLSLVLVNWYLGRERHRWVVLGAVAALGVLTHYSFAILLLALGLHLVVHWDRKVRVKELALAALVFIVILAPWLARNYGLFGDPFYSESRYMRFADGWEEYTKLEPPTAQYLLSKGYPYIAEHKLGALLNTFALVAGTVRDLLHGVFSLSDLALRLSLPSPSLLWVLGPLVFPFAILGLFKKKTFSRLTLLYLLSGLGAGLFFSWLDMPAGLMSEFFSPIVPLLIIVGVLGIGKLKKHAGKLLMLALAIVLVQTAYSFWFAHFSGSEKGWNYPAVLEFADSPALEWLRQNTDAGDVVMSNYALFVDYYTGRNSVVIPNEDAPLVAATAKKYDVRYILANRAEEKRYGLARFEGYRKETESGNLVIYARE